MCDTGVDEVETLVAGVTFCTAHRDGTIRPDTWDGIYHRDVRVVSAFQLDFDGVAPPLLAAFREGAGTAYRIHVLASDALGGPTATLRCRRTVGIAVRETWTVTVHDGTLEGELRLQVASDFAELVAETHDVPAREPVPYLTDGGCLCADGARFGVRVASEGPPPRVAAGQLVWQVAAAPGEPWTAGVTFRPRQDGSEVAAIGRARHAPEGLALSTSDPRWRASTASAAEDLEGLRVCVQDMGLAYLGAGAPWYMALFGRDTLLTGWSSLLTGSEVGLDVVEALARFQGRAEDPRTGEQPGRIVHEVRTGGAAVFGLAPAQPYYGTIDASPLFVMLLAELERWGADRARVSALLPAARAAVDWCIEFGDLDGDGYLEYLGDERGLANQGWKDSPAAMVHADGRRARAPIALVEVQAYAYAAYLALADLEERLGAAEHAPLLRKRADALRTAVARDFWLPGAGVLAMALDGEKRPLAVASSNMAHCLWAGLLDDELGALVAERLAQPDLMTAWGLRTLSGAEHAYNPLGYHLGSVWPHDSAIAAAGLMRYGHIAPALRLADGLLAAAAHFGWRLPELYGGFDADELPEPVPYPVACSPQAWSAAAPLLLLRTVLRLEPDVPAGRVALAPVLPDNVELALRIPLGGGTLGVRVRGSGVEVLELPPGVEVVSGALR